MAYVTQTYAIFLQNKSVLTWHIRIGV